MAELLFEFGRLQYILSSLLFVHLLLCVFWHRDHLRRDLTIIWFVVFLFCSAFIFLVSGLLGWITDGVGYSYAHLYGGMWSDEEALATCNTAGQVQRSTFGGDQPASADHIRCHRPGAGQPSACADRQTRTVGERAAVNLDRAVGDALGRIDRQAAGRIDVTGARGDLVLDAHDPWWRSITRNR